MYNKRSIRRRRIKGKIDENVNNKMIKMTTEVLRSQQVNNHIYIVMQEI